MSVSSSRSADDVDAHGQCGALDGPHRGLDGARRHVLHLHLRDLLHLLARHLPDLLLAGLVRAGALLLLRVEAGRLLEEDGRGRGLELEGEGPVRVHGDDDRDDERFLRLSLRRGVELLAELHDVDAVLAERRAHGRGRVRLSGGELQLDLSCDLLHRLFPSGPGCWPCVVLSGLAALPRVVHRYVFSTCMKSSSTGVARPKIDTRTRTLPLSGLTSSTVPLKFENGPSVTRTESPSSNCTLGLGFSEPSEICVVSRWTSASVTAGTSFGVFAFPTKPVTLAVPFTRCQVSRFISMFTRM